MTAHQTRHYTHYTEACSRCDVVILETTALKAHDALQKHTRESHMLRDGEICPVCEACHPSDEPICAPEPKERPSSTPNVKIVGDPAAKGEVNTWKVGRKRIPHTW